MGTKERSFPGVKQSVRESRVWLGKQLELAGVAPGVISDAALVLSEFAGAATELKQAFLCNPYDPEAVKDALLRAVTVDPPEALRRVRIMHRYLRAHDVDHWAHAFLSELGA
jgi:trehalose 6-phosphate synthase